MAVDDGYNPERSVMAEQVEKLAKDVDDIMRYAEGQNVNHVSLAVLGLIRDRLNVISKRG